MHRPAGAWIRTVAFLSATAAFAQAGIRRDIQDQYLRQYVNKTFFLRIPLYGARQELLVRQGGVTPFSGPSETSLSFRVGEQVRVTEIKFAGQEIRYQVSSVDLARQNEVTFRFPTQLDDGFSQRSLFDTALDKVFTEGLSNQEIDSAKQSYLKQEFGRLVQEMADTSGASREFVMAAIAGEIPVVEQSRRRAEKAESDLSQVRSRLEDEADRRRKAEQSLQQSRRESSQNESEVDRLKQEREGLLDKNAQLEREAKRLRSSSDEYKKQIDDMARALDVRTSSADDLSRSLSRLNQTVESLKQERDRLSGELEKAGRGLEEKAQENQKLSRDLTSARSERDKLRRDLRALTTNKEGLNSRFIQASNAKEKLETVLALGRALRLAPRSEERAEGSYVVADILLQERKIGTLEVLRPVEPGQTYPVRLSLDSPDTVQLTPEERQLHDALGDKLQVETAWRTSTEGLTVTLAQGEARREVAPRESAEWQWRFEGEIDRPQHASLLTRLVAEGEEIPLGDLNFEIRPAGLAGSVLQNFSLTWLIAGALLGMAAMLPVLFMRSKPRPARRSAAPPAKSPPTDEPYVAQKRF